MPGSRTLRVRRRDGPLVGQVPAVRARDVVAAVDLGGAGPTMVTIRLELTGVPGPVRVIARRWRLHQGGYRWSLSCPHCGEGGRQLHILRGRLACRTCQGLTYPTIRYARTRWLDEDWRPLLHRPKRPCPSPRTCAHVANNHYPMMSGAGSVANSVRLTQARCRTCAARR